MNIHIRPATPPSTQDTTRTDDLRIGAVRPLITPALLQEWLPTPDNAQALVASSRAAISRVLHGADDRLVVVVGPCSIHDHAQAMDYARQLKAQADLLKDDLLNGGDAGHIPGVGVAGQHDTACLASAHQWHRAATQRFAASADEFLAETGGFEVQRARQRSQLQNRPGHAWRVGLADTCTRATPGNGQGLQRCAAHDHLGTRNQRRCLRLRSQRRAAGQAQHANDEGRFNRQSAVR